MSSLLNSDDMKNDLMNNLPNVDSEIIDSDDAKIYNKSFIDAYNGKLNSTSYRESLVDDLVDDLKNSKKVNTNNLLSAEESADSKYNVVYNLASQIFQGRGIKHFAFICGDPGVGKSYSVKEAMKNEFPKGKLAAVGYKTWWDKGDIGKAISSVLAYFYKHREKQVLVLDDCDGFLTNKDPSVQNILKGLLELDNTDKNPAFITSAASIRNKANSDLQKAADADAKAKLNKTAEGWEFVIDKQALKEAFDFSKLTSKYNGDDDNSTRIEDEEEDAKFVDSIPERWRFTSRIIFISNLRQKDLNSAIDTRTTVYELALTKDEFLARLLKILPNMLKDVESSNSLDEINYAKNIAYAYITAAVELDKQGLIKISRPLEFRLISEFAGRWLLYHDLWCQQNNFKPQSDEDRNTVNNNIKFSFFKNEVVPYLGRGRK